MIDVLGVKYLDFPDVRSTVDQRLIILTTYVVEEGETALRAVKLPHPVSGTPVEMGRRMRGVGEER
jgi:hypothetical protein